MKSIHIHKIGIFVMCLLWVFAVHAYATEDYVWGHATYNNTVNLQNSSSQNVGPAGSGIGQTIGNSLYVQLLEDMYYHPDYGAWYCYCSMPNQSVTVMTTSGPADQETVVLVDDAAQTPDTFKNTVGLPTVLATAAPTQQNGTLELEDEQTISVSFTCMGDTASDTATVHVAATPSTMVVRNDTSFDSGTVLTGYIPNEATGIVYIRVTDTDENRKGYTAEMITVTVTSSVDSETLTLTESDANSGKFEFTDGLVLTDGSGAATNVLKVSSDAGGDDISVNYTDANNGNGDTASATISSTALVSDFEVEAAATQVAGVPFSLTITAKDSSGETLTTYTGTVNLTINHISPASGTMTISPTSVTGFSSGVATSNITYSDAGSITIKATDSDNTAKSGTSSNILFMPSFFTIATSSHAAPAIVNKAFTLTVTAKNAGGTVTPNYKGPADLTLNYVSPSTDQSGSLSTSTLSTEDWSGGACEIADMTYNKWGTVNIRVSENTATTTVATTSDMTFVPKDFLLELSDPPVSRDFYYIYEDFKATLTARDQNDNAVSNYQGTVTFTGETLSVPSNYTFTLGDAGSHIFGEINGAEEKEIQLSAKDTSYVSLASNKEDVSIRYGKIEVLDASGPVGKLGVTVRIVDSEGEIITKDDSTEFKVELQELVDNSSATSSAITTSEKVTDGTTEIYILDSESEKVTITPVDMEPDLDIEVGSVVFGTVSREGVGVQVYREVSEDGGVYTKEEEEREEDAE